MVVTVVAPREIRDLDPLNRSVCNVLSLRRVSLTYTLSQRFWRLYDLSRIRRSCPCCRRRSKLIRRFTLARPRLDTFPLQYSNWTRTHPVRVLLIATSTIPVLPRLSEHPNFIPSRICLQSTFRLNGVHQHAAHVVDLLDQIHARKASSTITT